MPDGRSCLPDFAVYVAADADLAAAETLAAHLGVPVVTGGPEPSCALALLFDGRGLALVGGGMEQRGDFARMLPRLRRDRLAGELLVKAARVKGADGPLTAIDATAGMGEDALLLAAAGFSVTLYERDPVIAALLRDALQRAAEVSGLADAVARMELREQDSVVALRRMGERGAAAPSPDVVLLDPMFPERTKSAAVKKKAQFLQLLEHPCDDEAALLEAAVAARPRKVVVKRPVKGPHLAGVKPDYAIAGKSVRYDVLVPATCSHR